MLPEDELKERLFIIEIFAVDEFIIVLCKFDIPEKGLAATFIKSVATK